jgi:hypothetical protein
MSNQCIDEIEPFKDQGPPKTLGDKIREEIIKNKNKVFSSLTEMLLSKLANKKPLQIDVPSVLDVMGDCIYIKRKITRRVLSK